MIEGRKGMEEAHYTEMAPDGVVLLGNVRIADAKHQEDEEAGGLVALICGYGRKPYTYKEV
jgi:hypothetical protein